MKVTNTDHTAINDNHSKCRMNQKNVFSFLLLMTGCYPYIHTFTVLDGVASAQRPTTAHRNEREL